MQLIYNRTGNPIGSVEEIDVDFPNDTPNSALAVDFDVKSPLNPGAAVYLTLTQPFPGVFLVPANAQVTSVGHVHAEFFDVVGMTAQTLSVHVLILEHAGDP